MNEWVVTYRVETNSGILIVEFYRGSRAECLRIAQHSAKGDSDQEQTGSWTPIIGPAQGWDEFLQAGVEVHGFTPVYAEAR